MSSSPLVILSLCAIVLLAVSALIVWKRRRSVLAGGATLIAVLTVVLSLTIPLMMAADTLADHAAARLVMIIVAITVTVIVMIFPLAVYVFVFVSGIVNLRREGMSLSHALSVGVCLGIAAMWIIAPYLSSHTQTPWLMLSMAVFQCVSYVALVASSYVSALMVNLVHRRHRSFDYVIVLGAGLAGDRVTPLLASRIQRGVEIAQRSSHTYIVMSGGQGDDEALAEGQAMARYAREELGLCPSRILIEDRSTTTRENILLSWQIIREHWRRVYKSDEASSDEVPDATHTPHGEPRLAVVTNTYHVLRALLMARTLGVPCVGYGARTRIYFSINAFIREFIAYLSVSWRLHTLVMAIMALPWLTLALIAMFQG